MNLQNEKLHPKNVAAKLCDPEIVTVLNFVKLLSGFLILRGDEIFLCQHCITGNCQVNLHTMNIFHCRAMAGKLQYFVHRKLVEEEARKVALKSNLLCLNFIFGHIHNSQTTSHGKALLIFSPCIFFHSECYEKLYTNLHNSLSLHVPFA